nr:probable RNA-directed RNA polymerase (EC 2.7.7.48) - garlic latent virus [Garlic latent virus]
MTFEKACEREGKPVVIMDDYGKLPAGYVDAYLSIKSNVELVVLTGDQRQSVYHNRKRDSEIRLLSNTDHFKKYCDYYVNATHRQPRRLANPIKVHAEREVGGAVKHATLIPETAMTLVPAFRSQSLLTDLGRQHDLRWVPRPYTAPPHNRARQGHPTLLRPGHVHSVVSSLRNHYVC